LYDVLPREVREVADKNYALLKENPRHPSLHFKSIGELWSVRVGLHHRALGIEVADGILWNWIVRMLNTTKSSDNKALLATCDNACA
jgi:hypothetical protein